MSSSPHPAQQIVLVGLSGVGKSTVGRELAERLGWPLIDTDDMITEHEGMTPAQLIEERGEAPFRQFEESAIARAAESVPAIIATGGGAFLSARSRSALGKHGFICYLDATPGEIARRISASSDDVQRPLLGEDMEARLHELDIERRPYYSHADLWVPMQGAATADESMPRAAAARILRAWAADTAPEANRDQRLARLGTDAPARGPAAVVDTGDARYPVWVGAGELVRLPERLAQLELTGTVYLISDREVMEAHGERVASVLDGSGIAGVSYVVPPGESSKRPRVAEELYGWLAEQHAERQDIVVALGGGVLCDLAGYVAATYLRGMPLIHLPTSVLAMSDAAIGGKVAVDLPAGKNLVGAFHQPRAVIADTEMLTTLPRRILVEGFAEVIKHALILDPALLSELERHAGVLTSGVPDLELLTRVIARSARLKALIVSTDPAERGLREILNYGHTIGHAIEAAGGYSDYRHGEAVAVGMMGAARIAQRIGLIDEDTVARQADLLRAFGLPLSAPGLQPADVMQAMQLDKKVRDGRLRFVLLEEPGRAVLRDDVHEQLVAEVVRGLLTS